MSTSLTTRVFRSRKSFKTDDDLRHCRLELFEDGTEKLVPCPVVAPSRADDFSIASNALLRFPSSPQYRVNTDPVDLDINFKELV